MGNQRFLFFEIGEYIVRYFRRPWLQMVEVFSSVFIHISTVLLNSFFSCRQLNAYPKGNKGHNFLSLFLEVAGYGSLPSGWRRHVRFRLIVVNQRSETLSRQNGKSFPLLGPFEVVPASKLFSMAIS